MISIFFFILLIFLSLNIGYLILLAVAGIKVNAFAETDEKLKFNVLVPAHEEEASIANLLHSLKSVSYPSELINITVVADHCSDNTVNIVKNLGYEVIDRQSGERGKSSAVADGIIHIKNLMQNENDVLVIFDADNIVDKNFFVEMNKALIAGAEIAQGNTGIHNKMETIFTRLNYVNFAVTNRFKELARSQANLTCRLRGHGMAFRKSVVDELSWKASSLVEDQELTLEIVLKGYRVQWVHNAHVDSVIPATAKDAAVQRKRWAGGKSMTTKHAVKILFKHFIKTKSLVPFDLMIDYMMSSYSIQLGLVIMGVFFSALVFGFSSWQLFMFLLIAILYFCYYLIASWLEKVPLSAFSSFFLSPFFIFWRVWIFISSIRGSSQWS